MDLSKTLNIADFDKICRICLKSNESLTNIFLTQLKMKILSDVIMECAPIQIKIDDQFPQSICYGCLKELHRIVDFRCVCVESNEKLQAAFIRGQGIITIKSESEEDSPSTSKIFEKDKKASEVPTHELRDQSLSPPIDSDFSSDSNIPLSRVKKSRKKKTKNLILEENSNESSGVTNEEYKQDEYGYFRCPHCDDYFKLLGSLKRHIKVCVSRIERIKDSLTNDIEKKIVIPFRRSFKRYGPNQLPIETDSNGHFLCPDCKTAFENKNKMLRHHMQYHIERKYKCPECNKAFHRLSYLREHIHSHTNERPNSCEFCGKQFRHGKSLTFHRKIHLDAEKFTCAECNKTFALKKCLRNHMRTHTGERPFVCEICGKSFNRRHILKTHRMIHTGERPYECNVCQKKFICKQQLTLHAPKHGLILVKKPDNVQSENT